MPDLHMGPSTFRFEKVVIERLVKPGEGGNYALGIKDESGEFVPQYIGRADYDLLQELMSKVEIGKYPYFKFSTAGPRAAYQMQCANFHAFSRQIENKEHPVAPQGSGFTCFLCGQ